MTFRSALFTTTLNQNNKDVFIPGISSSIMRKVVDYAYLRHCDITEHNVHELMVISDYVGMVGLMKLCIEFLINTLTPTNCVKRMLFARFVMFMSPIYPLHNQRVTENVAALNCTQRQDNFCYVILLLLVETAPKFWKLASTILSK